jgi:transposase
MMYEKTWIFFSFFVAIGACAFGASRYSTSMENTDDLPADIESCQARIRELSKRVESLSAIASAKDPQAVIVQQQRTIDELRKQLDELQAEQDKLQRLLARLLKGNRSERQIINPAQAFLPFENQAELEAAQAEAQAEAEAIIDDNKNRPDPKPRKRRSESFPDHLPRKERIVDVPESMAVCDLHGPRQVIGYDVTEKLVKIPAQLFIEQIKYPKLACPGCPTCGIASPERPTGLVEGDRYDTSIAASIIQAKWDHHMPVYRQQDIFAGSGWTPARSTLLNIIASACFVISPMMEFMKRRVQSDIGVGIDDTSCRMLLPDVEPVAIEGDAKNKRLIEKVREARQNGSTSLLAKMWVYSGLATAPYNIFDFRVSRHRDGPDEFFANSQGIVQGDCFSGNTSVVIHSEERLTFVACWGHARRKLVDAKTYKAERETLIGLIQQLYDIETREIDYAHEDRQALRQRESTLILDCIRKYIDSPSVTAALPKSDFVEAIRYISNHWDALNRYVNDGRIPIDNNRVEQLMKQVAMGRKAWLFVGNVEAGERSAMLMSLVSSAKRHDLDVWVYIKDVLDQLLAGETDYEKLLPDRWKLDHPDAVRKYRIEERRDKAARKQLDAARRRLLARKK